MAQIATSRGFKVQKILTKKATRKNVISSIKNAAENLKSGDIFLLTYAGHGGQIRDKSGDEGEDGKDETWCLYDAQLLDDEFYSLWETFEKGVRILVISDSCHSGTLLRGGSFSIPNIDLISQLMSFSMAEIVYKKNKKFYDNIIEKHKHKKRMDGDIKASIIFMSSCQDNQSAAEVASGGFFTSSLKRVWNNGKFKGDYRKFYEQIVKKMPPWQSPNYVTLGEPNKEFERQIPFTI